MGTIHGHRLRDAPRACSICGHLWYKSDLTRIGPLEWACPDDKDGLTALQISRHNANARPLTVRSVRHALGMQEIPTHQQAEGEILNAILTLAPQQIFLAEEGLIGANADTLTGLDQTRTIGIVMWYLGNLVLENERPRRWIEQATAKLVSMANTQLLFQFRDSVAIGGNFNYQYLPNSALYGGFYAPPPNADLGGDTVALDVTGAAWCMLGFLRAYRVTGTVAYRDAARRTAHFLRRSQVMGSLANIYATASAALDRLQPGAFVERMTIDFSSGHPAVPVDGKYRYRPSGIICALALSELLAIDGDASYGGTATPDFALDPGALLSVAVQQCVDWWTNGQTDSSTGVLTVGFGAATPKASFNSSPATISAAAVWASFEAGATGIRSVDWAIGLRALYQIGGQTAKVLEVNSYLRGLTQASAAIPATWNTDQVARSLRGTFNPNLCLPAEFLNGADVDGGGYDWRTVGVLAPLQSALDDGAFAVAKDTMTDRRRRKWTMRMNSLGNPINAQGVSGAIEAAQFFPRDLPDDLRLLTQSGYSFQTSIGRRRPEWNSASGLANGHYCDLQGAVLCADAYRYEPKASSTEQG